MPRPRSPFEILLVVVLFLLATTYVLAANISAREVRNRAKCASNLRQIAQAFLLYANDNRGVFPRTRYAPDRKPTWGTPYEGPDELGPDAKADPFAQDDLPEVAYRPAANDVTAALFLLARTQDIGLDVFVCPSMPQSRPRLGEPVHHWTNWNGVAGLRKHLSYSVQNPYGTPAVVGMGWKWNNTMNPEFVLMADMNPGTESLLKLNAMSPQRDMRTGNSPNHRRDGQNVLYAAGHVEFHNNPFAGVQRDNIYTFGTDKPGIVGDSASADDTVLLPTARDLGIIDAEGKFLIAPPRPQALPDAQAAAIRDNLVGRYQAMQGIEQFELEVTPTEFIATSGPITIRYQYRIIGNAGENGILVDLSAPKADTESPTLEIRGPDLIITDSSYLDGTWRRQ
jgi:hypothetical protein